VFQYGATTGIDWLYYDSGSPNGGEMITIYGHCLDPNGTTRVQFGGIEAENVFVEQEPYPWVGQFHVMCTVPPAVVSGAVDVTVISPDASIATLPAGYTYRTAQIYGYTVAPRCGALAGGDTLSFSGQDFWTHGTTRVLVDGVDATNVTVLDQYSLTCTTPPGAGEGVVEVVMIAPDGSVVSAGNAFHYGTNPAPTSLDVPAGSVAGGTEVRIYGYCLDDAARVLFDGVDASNVRTESFMGPVNLICNTPPGERGAVDVTILDQDGGSGVLPGAFTYVIVPRIDRVAPTCLPLYVENDIEIFGEHFSTTPGAVGVYASYIGDASNVAVWDNGTRITCTVPAAWSEMALGISVQNYDNDAREGSRTNVAHVGFSPVLAKVTPSEGGAGRESAVRIDGYCFTTSGTTRVQFNGVEAANVVVHEDAGTGQPYITCTAPAIECYDCPVPVSVINPDDSSGTMNDAFIYRPVPELYGIWPSGQGECGQTVTIWGCIFPLDTEPQVTFGGVPAESVETHNFEQIVCRTPRIEVEGPVTVIVSFTDSLSATLENGYYAYPNQAPWVSYVEPECANPAGGIPVIIHGGQFTTCTAPVRVHFGGYEATDVVVLSATEISCTTPAGPPEGSVTVTVTNPSGAYSDFSDFCYSTRPRISSVSPDSGLMTGGGQATIYGKCFSPIGTTRVFFGSYEAADVEVVPEYSAYAVRCTIPESTGQVFVSLRVVNGDGAESTGTVNFNYIPVPHVTSVSPTSGPGAACTLVTIGGYGFQYVSSVRFGGIPASNIQYYSGYSVTCVAPPGITAGCVDVTVIDSFLQQSTLPAAYCYNWTPTLTSVVPECGALGGGTEVTLAGSNLVFLPSARVLFGTAEATVLSVTGGGTALHCTTPPGTVAGPADVTVINPGDVSVTLPGAFHYGTNTNVTSVSPLQGPTSGGMPVTIEGLCFNPNGTTQVLFDGVQAPSVMVHSGGETGQFYITCTTPAVTHTGPIDVTVSNSDGSSGTLIGGFTCDHAPYPTGLWPNTGYGRGGATVAISGLGFDDTGTTRVTFGGIDATNVEVLSNYGAPYISCVTPPAPASGLVDVVVYNPDGSSAALPQAFRYNWTPVITSVSPASVPLGGNIAVTVAGDCFMPAGTVHVRFGGVEATQVSVRADAQQITCVVPPRATPGKVELAIANPDGTNNSMADAVYYATAPQPAGVSPAKGRELGGTMVRIRGAGFSPVEATYYGETAVMFGDAPATVVMVESETEIRCITPPHEPGKVDVTVAGPDGSASTLQNAFEYTVYEVSGFNMGALAHYGGEYGAIAVSGSYALLASGPELIVIDVSDAANPRDVGRWICPNSEDPETGVHDPGQIEEIQVANGLVFVSARKAGLRIVDISNPAKPVELGSYPAPDVRGCVVAGSFAYIADQREGTTDLETGIGVIDVSDPRFPARKGFMLGEGLPLEILTPRMAYANYVFCGTELVIVADVRDPLHPVLAEPMLPGSENFRMCASGDRVFAFGLMGDPGSVFQIQTAPSPGILNDYPVWTGGSAFRDIASYAQHLYLPSDNITIPARRGRGSVSPSCTKNRCAVPMAIYAGKG